MIRSRYTHNFSEASALSGISCPEPSLAQQNFKDACDINRIVKQFQQTGLVPGNSAPPLPDAFHGIISFHEAMNLVKRGEEAFAALDPSLRAHFQNDASSFVDFVSDEKNRDEAIKLGLIAPPPALDDAESSLPSPTPKGAAEGGAQ